MPNAPVPFPRVTTNALITDDLTAWASNGWVETGTGPLSAGGGWIAPDQLELFIQQLGPLDPPVQGTRQSKTYPGLPPGMAVRVVCDVAWNYADFGASGKPIGMWVNDVFFAPNTTPSGTITPNIGQCVGYGRVNGSGQLTVGVGAEGITGSCDILIIFANIEVAPQAADFADIIIDSAIAWEMGNPMSITRGSLSFEANEEWENYPFPGKTMPVVGLDEVVRSKPVVKGNMMMTGEPQISMYRPGGSWDDGDSAGGVTASNAGGGAIRTFTPGQFRAALAAGAYLENFIVIWKRLRGDYIAVEFPIAVCTHFGISAQDSDEGLIAVEIEARQANDGTPKTSLPYLVHLLPASFTFPDGE